MDRTRLQRWAENSLASHPSTLELRGSPRNLVWPRICAHCGELASGQIVVKKAFRPLPRRVGTGGNGLRHYRIGSAPVPFCARCAATHRATVQRPSIVSQVLRLVVNPLIIPVVGSAWLGTLALEGWRTNPIADPGRVPEWAVVLFLFGVSAWCLFLIWRTTAPSRLESQTEITQSCDFSQDVSGMLERERRIYSLRNKAFADALEAGNRDQVWTPQEQARSMKMGLILGVGMIAFLAGLVGVLKLMGI
jgi:hypothetical protein